MSEDSWVTVVLWAIAGGVGLFLGGLGLIWSELKSIRGDFMAAIGRAHGRIDEVQKEYRTADNCNELRQHRGAATA